MIDQWIFIIAINVALICALWWFFQGPYKQYLIDRARQDLFAIRDEIFDLAAEGRIAFDSDAYTKSRTIINGMIRFIHQLSVTRLAIIMMTHRHDPYVTRYKRELDAALGEVDQEVANIIRDKMDRMHRIVLRRIIYGSLAVMMLLAMTWAVVFISSLAIRMTAIVINGVIGLFSFGRVAHHHARVFNQQYGRLAWLMSLSIRTRYLVRHLPMESVDIEAMSTAYEPVIPRTPKCA